MYFFSPSIFFVCLFKALGKLYEWLPASSAGSLKLRVYFPSSAKARKEKKSLIPTAIEDVTFIMGFSTPVGKALGVHNSERAESRWYRFYSSFLVMLVHFFLRWFRMRVVSPITTEPISCYIALSLSWHRRGFAGGSSHVRSLQAGCWQAGPAPNIWGGNDRDVFSFWRTLQLFLSVT